MELSQILARLFNFPETFVVCRRSRHSASTEFSNSIFADLSDAYFDLQEIRQLLCLDIPACVAGNPLVFSCCVE